MFCKKNIKLNWDIRARVNTIDKELLKLMKKAGCTRIHYGVEAGTEKILKVLRKGINLQQVKNAFKLTKQAGIETAGYFMIGSPTENLDDIKATINLSKELFPDYVHFYVTTPFPATELYFKGLQDNIIKKDYWKEFSRNPQPGFKPPAWEENFTRDELFKILNYGRGQGLRHLQNTALLENILPEVTALIGMQQPPQFHPEGDVFTHTCNTLDALDTRVADELLVAAMLHDIGKPATAEKDGDRIRFNQHAKVGAEIAEKICQRFRLAKWQTNLVKQMILQHMRFMDVQKMKLSTLKRFLKQENFSKHLELHRADCLASHKKLANYRFCHQQLTRLKEDEEKQEGEPKPLLNGRDLIAIGFSPGPLFATILREMEDAQLEGVVSTKKQAMDLAVQKFWSFDK